MIKTTIYSALAVLLTVTATHAGDGKERIRKRDEIHSSYRFQGLPSNYASRSAEWNEFRERRPSAPKYRDTYERF